MSDGRSLADFAAEHFNLPYIPPHFKNDSPSKYTKYGVNFASSGCGIYNNTKPRPDWKCKPLSSQVEAFDSYVKLFPKVDLDKSLALISVGQNDILWSHTNVVPSFIADLTRDIKKLVNGGMRNILIMNLPPLGCYPPYRLQFPNHECDMGFNSLVLSYNDLLFDMVEELKHPSTGFNNLTIRIVDMYSVVQEVMVRPRAVGIKYVEHPCCEMVNFGCVDSSVMCEDKTEYAFFDSYHLTERMYELIFLHMQLSYPLR